MSPAVFCQASSMILAKGVQGVPLQQQLGFSRPQTPVFASSGAFSSGSTYASSSRAVARAEFEDGSEDVLAKFVGSRRESATSSGRPSFRSALEQVSFETQNMAEAFKSKPRRQGVMSKVAHIFRK